MKPDKNRARGIGFYMLIGVIILAVVFYLTTPVEQKEYTYSEIEDPVPAGEGQVVLPRGR